MARVIFVVGLSGSGKSYYSKKLKDDLGPDVVVIDDYQNYAYDNNPDFEWSQHFDELIRLLKAGGTCIVNDIAFCKEYDRFRAVESIHRYVPNVTIEWVCFENNPDQCRRNILYRCRNDGRAPEKYLNAVAAFVQKYTYPAGATLLPVPDAE